MTRDEALELLKQHLKNKNLVKHCLSVEACMRALAVRLGHDPEPWGLAGILHDLDYEVTEKSPEHHTTETVKILREKGIAEPIIHAVQAHAGKVPCESPMDWAIYSVDPLTGLIIAATLMHPDEEDQVHRPRVRQAALQGKELRQGRPPRGDRGVAPSRARARRVPVDRHRGHAGHRRRPRPLMEREGRPGMGDFFRPISTRPP